MKQKKIKVQYKSRWAAHGYTDTPMIQMTGRWLETLGFSIGDTVMMEYGEDGIRIRPLTLEEQTAAAKEELELSIRRKERELNSLQRQIASDRRQAAMVAEPGHSYSGEVIS